MTSQRFLVFGLFMAASDRFLEYGAGGSTSLAHLCNVPRITSVESNGEFAETIRIQFPRQGAIVLHADLGDIGDWGDPIDKAPTPENRDKWNNYANCPWDFFENNKEDPPEFILIDGAVRTLCILTSFMRLPEDTNALFMLDDAQYVDYSSALPFMIDKSMVEDVKDDERGRRIKQGLLFRRDPHMDREACAAAILSFTIT